MPYVSVPNYRSNGYLFNIRGSAVLALRGLNIDFINEYTEDDVYTAAAALSEYIDALTKGINPAFPYVVEIAGEIAVINPDESISRTEVLVQGAALSMERICPVCVTENGVSQWQLFAKGILRFDGRAFEESTAIPLDSILSLHDT